jgi:predicted acylesterase/phospholipase RssA
LAGGGFRASLFHLGVFRRLAELDILRYVEVLSTVSGGSIIGALYALLLKKYLERTENKQELSRDEYVQLVAELRTHLVSAIQKNLRTRLFMNPLGILRVLLTHRSLGQRMASLYEGYIYRAAVTGDRILLKDILISPGQKRIEGGVETYNRRVVDEAVKRPKEEKGALGSVVTKLVLNATSLNSGARFWYSAVELGDWFLGHFRHDEIEALAKRKTLLEQVGTDRMRRALGSDGTALEIDTVGYERSAVSFALWMRERSEAKARGRGDDPPSETVLTEWGKLSEVVPELPSRLMEAHLGRLRFAKLHAWYLRRGPRWKVTGGFDSTGHMNRFWHALDRIDPDCATKFEQLSQHDRAEAGEVRDLLLDFVMETYWFRTAQVMSYRIGRDWDQLRLADAVGASACFPPVFPPFQVLGFYDDVHVSRLGLTDGGVFDNMGLTALLDEECTNIIVSDTGGLFETVEHVSTGRLGMMGRVTSILMADVGWKQQDNLDARHKVSQQITEYLEKTPQPGDGWREFHAGRELYGLASFHISSDPIAVENEPSPIEPPIDRKELAKIRTDLDGFGEVEVAALVDHGYLMADRYVRRNFTDSPYRNDEFWKEKPELPDRLAVGEREKKIVHVGQSRFGRALRLKAFVSWFVTLAAVAMLIGAIWTVRRDPVSVVATFQWLAARAASGLESALPIPVSGWTQRKWSVGLLGLVLGGAIALWLLVTRILHFSVAEWLKRKGALTWARRITWLAKWARGTSGNILWFFGGAPLWIALFSAVSASVSYLFFHLPFMRAARKM